MFRCILWCKDNLKAFARDILKRLTAIMLAILIAVNPYIRARASLAVSIAAVGGVAALCAFMAASGIYLYSEGGAFDGTGVKNLWSEWANDNERGGLGGAANFIPGPPNNLDETEALAVAGGLVFTIKLLSMFEYFCKWLVQKFDIKDSEKDQELINNIAFSNKVGPGDTVLYGKTGTALDIDYNFARNSNASPDVDVYLFVKQLPDDDTGHRYGLCQIIDGDRGQLGAVLEREEEVVWQYNYEVGPYGHPQIYTFYYFPSTSYSYNRWDGSSRYVRQVESYIPICPYDTDTATDIAYVMGYISDTGHTGISVDTGVIDIPSYEDGTEDRQGILIPGVTPGMTAQQITDTIYGYVEDRGFESAGAKFTDVQLDGVTITDGMYGTNPVINQDGLVVSQDDIPLDTTAYQIQTLSDVFPFSIPWDLYNLVILFNAEPVAPNIDVDIPLVWQGLPNIQFSIDLSQYNDVAKILRAGEYLLFFVGIMMFLYKKFG